MHDPRPVTLSVSDIHKSFGSLDVLKGISIQAQKGDVISILGASGSGKSTLLRCINLLETPDAGVVSVGGETIEMKHHARGHRLAANPKQIERLRSRLGMVFQSFNLWSHMTVLQNVIEGPHYVLKRWAIRMLMTWKLPGSLPGRSYGRWINRRTVWRNTWP